ncbi:GGDEF domain-containing protein [Pseudomonas luteola]|uniref:sensor domain-containing diguanylate cyclase n=1 Tax=Pseudomonas TaxID=286 RepID=UPI003DA17D0D
MRLYGVMLFWIVFFSASLQAETLFDPLPRAVILNDAQEKVSLHSVSYLQASATLTFEQAAAAGLEDRWQSLGDETVNLGRQQIGAWLRFEVHNPTDRAQQRYLVIQPPILNQVDVRVRSQSSESWGPVETAGDSLPMSIRSLKERAFVFPLTLSAGDKAFVYLRLRSYEPMLVPMWLMTPEHYQAQEKTSLALLTLFFGFMLALLVYNGSRYWRQRDPNHLWYCLYLVSILGYELSLTGIGQRYLWPEWPAFSIRTYVGFGCLSFLTLMIEPAGLVSCLLGIAMTLSLWRKGNPSAKYLAIAWSVLAVSTILMLMAILDWITLSPFILDVQIIGFAFEFMLLSVALDIRHDHEGAERLNIQKEALLASNQQVQRHKQALQAQQQTLERQHKRNEELQQHIEAQVDVLERANEALRAANDEVIRLSTIDTLTGALSRPCFDRHFTEEVNRAKRNQVVVSLVVIDIDHFKEINDAFGSPLGDECLRALAGLLKNYTKRAGDMAARFRDDTFVLVLPAAGEADAVALANRICAETSMLRLEYGSATVSFSVSAGIASIVPTLDDSDKSLINTALKALSHAKQEGRNRAYFGEV